MQSAEYVLALQLLNRGPLGRQRESIYRALDYSRSEIDVAIEALEKDGVVEVNGRYVRASTALSQLDRLGLIAV